MRSSISPRGRAPVLRRAASVVVDRRPGRAVGSATSSCSASTRTSPMMHVPGGSAPLAGAMSSRGRPERARSSPRAGERARRTTRPRRRLRGAGPRATRDHATAPPKKRTTSTTCRRRRSVEEGGRQRVEAMRRRATTPDDDALIEWNGTHAGAGEQRGCVRTRTAPAARARCLDSTGRPSAAAAKEAEDDRKCLARAVPRRPG